MIITYWIVNKHHNPSLVIDSKHVDFHLLSVSKSFLEADDMVLSIWCSQFGCSHVHQKFQKKGRRGRRQGEISTRVNTKQHINLCLYWQLGNARAKGVVGNPRLSLIMQSLDLIKTEICRIWSERQCRPIHTSGWIPSLRKASPVASCASPRWLPVPSLPFPSHPLPSSRNPTFCNYARLNHSDLSVAPTFFLVCLVFPSPSRCAVQRFQDENRPGSCRCYFHRGRIKPWIFSYRKRVTDD